MKLYTQKTKKSKSKPSTTRKSSDCWILERYYYAYENKPLGTTTKAVINSFQVKYKNHFMDVIISDKTAKKGNIDSINHFNIYDTHEEIKGPIGSIMPTLKAKSYPTLIKIIPSTYGLGEMFDENKLHKVFNKKAFFLTDAINEQMEEKHQYLSQLKEWITSLKFSVLDNSK